MCFVLHKGVQADMLLSLPATRSLYVPHVKERSDSALPDILRRAPPNGVLSTHKSTHFFSNKNGIGVFFIQHHKF
jgi:hypothetical protein